MSTLSICPVCGAPCAECMRNRDARHAALRKRMAEWRAFNRLSIQRASMLAGCTDCAWMDWENGAPFSETWEQHIAGLLSENNGFARMEYNAAASEED